MKKTTFLFTIALFLIPTQEGTAQQPGTNVTVEDKAVVGNIVTSSGNTLHISQNFTQIFGKSPEYDELKKRLVGLEAAIGKKADDCGQMEKDGLPAKYRDGCRAELLALNAERDSVQKIETRFREDVIRLAESFANIPLNSERLRLAKQLFDEGKIREADNVLKEKDMAATGDAALATKARNDSVLLQTANEFALKAQLKALKMDYDSAQILFAQSRKYFETVENLQEFANLLGKQNQSHRALEYFEKALKLARSESEEAALAMNLGTFYADVQKIAEAEKMFLRSLDIYERLAKSNPAQFEPDLASTCMRLGNVYSDVQKMGEAEKMYLRSLDIRERLAKSNPAQFEPDLARTCVNLGIFYNAVQKMGEAEKMYLRSLDIYERLAKSNPAQFEPDLARTAMNLGIFYQTVQKMGEAEKMYLRSLEICERLAKSNPAQFEPDLAFVLNNFGYFRQVSGQFEEAKKMYSRGLALRQKAVASGQTYFWDELNRIYQNMASLRDSFERRGEFASAVAIQGERADCMYSLKGINIDYKLEAASAYNELYLTCFYAKMYKESIVAAERILELAPNRNWVRTNLGHAHLLRGEWDKAKAVYEEYLKNEPDSTAAKKILLKDWDDLEKAGVTHKDMEKARAWAKE